MQLRVQIHVHVYAMFFMVVQYMFGFLCGIHVVALLVTLLSVCLQAKNSITNEVVAIKKMNFSGKQASEVSIIAYNYYRWL